jgi:hypothetical protein
LSSEYKISLPAKRPTVWPYNYDQVAEGDLVVLAPEPTNPVDSNAIAFVDETGAKLGYVPASVASIMAPMIRDKTIQIKEASVEEILRDLGSDYVEVVVSIRIRDLR